MAPNVLIPRLDSGSRAPTASGHTTLKKPMTACPDDPESAVDEVPDDAVSMANIVLHSGRGQRR